MMLLFYFFTYTKINLLLIFSAAPCFICIIFISDTCGTLHLINKCWILIKFYLFHFKEDIYVFKEHLLQLNASSNSITILHFIKES